MHYRRYKKLDQASHADDWLMTYADMITLLLCFFVIFLSVSVPKKEAGQTVSKPRQEEPSRIEGNLPFHGIPHADLPTSGTYITIPVKQLPETEVIAKTAVPLPEITTLETRTDFHPVDKLPPEPLAPAEVKPSTSLPEIVDRLKAGGPADIEQKGDRITTLQMNSAAFFDSGSAVLSESGKAILQDVSVNLKSELYKDYQVTVEGHTDDQHISTPQYPSNWELSTSRAAAVVQYFLQQGVAAQKLRAAGYADTFPVAPNRDAGGKAIPENQARNRRVVIKLEKIVKAE
jgi:chemotaxis protein MotB